MNSKEEFTIQMKTKVAEIEEILKRYLPEAEGYQKVIMEAAIRYYFRIILCGNVLQSGNCG